MNNDNVEFTCCVICVLKKLLNTKNKISQKKLENTKKHKTLRVIHKKYD